MRSGLLAPVPRDVPLQGGFDDVGHLVAALLHEGGSFVPHGADADGADGCLSGRGSPCHAKNVTQKSGPSTCVPVLAVSFLYYKNSPQAGETDEMSTAIATFADYLLADSIDMDIHPVHGHDLADAADRARPAIRDYVAYADCGSAEERARHNAAIGHNPRSTYVYDLGTAH